MSRWERLVEVGVLFLLAFTPFAFGTVQPWSESIAELVVLGMALVFVVARLRDWELRVELPPGWLPAALFLALVVVQAWVPGLSLDPHATWRSSLKLLAVAVLFVLAYNVYRTRAQVQRAVWTMIVVGTAVAVLGIVQRVTWNGHLYWIGPRTEHTLPFGPFVNRTHFAGLMVIVIPLALALVMSRHRATRRRTRSRTWRERFREWNSFDGDATNLVPFLIVVMGGAALVSGSRGGLVAVFVALLAMTAGARGGATSSAGRATRVGVLALLAVLAGIWIGGDILYGTVERLAEEIGRPGEGNRLVIWTDALDLWRTAPVTGTGLSTFAVAFGQVRTVRAPVVYSHAESDWVQLLTDTGVIGLGLALAVAWSGLRLIRRYRKLDGTPARMFSLAGLVALGGTVVQGVGNYNLPVMSNLIYLAIAVAVAHQGVSGFADVCSRSTERSSSRRTSLGILPSRDA